MRIDQVGAGATLQDDGRWGYGHLGVSPSGPADPQAFALVNRLLGNRPGTAVIEIGFGGLTLTATADALVAVTGASLLILVGARPEPMASLIALRAGQRLALGVPSRGVWTYLGVRGGWAADPVLGSVATDTLSGIGPPPLRPGQTLNRADAVAGWPAIAQIPLGPGSPGPGSPGTPDRPVQIPVTWGPRPDRIADPAGFLAAQWQVQGGDRVGLRLVPQDRPETRRAQAAQRDFPSEAVVAGGIQVPPSGEPVIFGPDHPVTGGYPVIAVVDPGALGELRQCRPGQSVTFLAPPLTAPGPGPGKLAP